MKNTSAKISWILNFLLSGIGLYFFDKLVGSKIKWDEIEIMKFLSTTISLTILDIIVFIILVLIGFVIIRKIFKNKNSYYSKKQQKIRENNTHLDNEAGIQFTWDVFFDYGDKPYINNLTPFCTKHGNTPLRMVNDRNYYGGLFKCSVPNCENSVNSEGFNFLKNAIESELIKKYNEMKK